MGSSLFGNNPKNQMNNPMQMLSEFNKFKKSMEGKNPQQIVENLLATNQMTSDQFNQLKEMAKSLQGFLK